MPNRLPPLGALRAFEAAARHLSFKKAAAELYVSPAAISHQISTLETFLGVSLFERLNRGLKLTDVGRAGLASISSGFQALQTGVALMRSTQGRARLAIGAGPAFAAKWLLPRLHRFVAANPDIDVRIVAGMQAVDGYNAAALAAAEPGDDMPIGADIEVRFGSGKYPGCKVDKLFAVSLLPVCNPKMLTGTPPLQTPEDLRHHTLLHDDAVSALDGQSDWSAWLRLAGVTELTTAREAHFTHGALTLQAAADGLGVALAMDVLCAADIEAGRLVAPFAATLPLRSAYYTACAVARAQVPQIGAFREWLCEEAGVQQKNHK